MEDKCMNLWVPLVKSNTLFVGNNVKFSQAWLLESALKFSSLPGRFLEKLYFVPSNLCSLIYCGILEMKSSFLF